MKLNCSWSVNYAPRQDNIINSLYGLWVLGWDKGREEEADRKRESTSRWWSRTT
jgi:hypothetical protein